MMRYVSVDIETTGLNPDTDQVLQIAAVVDTDPAIPVEQLPTYTAILKHTRVSGSPFAMAMNAGLLSTIADGKAAVYPEVAVKELLAFLYAYATNNKIVAAGKNFASFDRQFLRQLDPNLNQVFHHRSIDPAMFFVTGTDTVPPDTLSCMCRAGIVNELRHDALEDARAVVRLVRYGMVRHTQATSVPA